ncbi:uncharacterized protein Tco025E_05059 [Trypanosoma conorhini]|uniref:Uncharacterized protein n=1 Tax=Trypanosoma conorhini TaxID=83891 RepID=A0A3R7L6A9_9TRYP|nr:uncharacterized protein Tco025E_05059 [Trypanosoma conorhini]RNF17073.1 hypothetical protein Tco025E_05059 [Trypanosoma conorhini]
MQHAARDTSPMVERPVNTAAAATQGKETRSVSGSTLPVSDLDPTTRQLLEENEGMLYRISTLTRELQAAKAEIQGLNAAVAEKNKEVEAMREKLEGANITACDASGRVINYKAECERLIATNKTLTEDYEKVRLELDQRTEDIRQATDRKNADSARRATARSEEQFCGEVLSLLSSVDFIAPSLRRCTVDVADRERALDNVQKELALLQRSVDAAERLNHEEKNVVEEVLSAARGKKSIQSTRDATTLIRWMVSEGLLSGMEATEKNLEAVKTLLTSHTEGGKKNAAGAGEEKATRPSATSGGRRFFQRPSR